MAGSTLSADAKDALARTPVAPAHCRSALRDGLIAYGVAPGTTVFRTGRTTIARLLWSLLDDRKDRPIRRVAGTRLARLPSYEIDVDPAVAPLPRSRCDRRMELRAAFLACGSISSPSRGYHLEFVPPKGEPVRRLVAALRAESLHPKVAPRKGREIVYFKNIEEITQLLAAIGSSGALLHLEDVRALKETKNRIHRLVNTEAANVDRAASAAASQARWITLLADAYGLRKLSAPLREIAELRLGHPSETLAELGRRCSPEAKKSTVNGRIAALVRLARSLHAAGSSAPASEASDLARNE